MDYIITVIVTYLEKSVYVNITQELTIVSIILSMKTKITPFLSRDSEKLTCNDNLQVAPYYPILVVSRDAAADIPTKHISKMDNPSSISTLSSCEKILLASTKSFTSNF